MQERTLLLVKPDGVVRGKVGEVVQRLERKGLKLVGIKLLGVSRSRAEELYAVHRGKPFYQELVKHITSAPVVACLVEGQGAISVVRKLIGTTDPAKAEPGSIRGDFGLTMTRNVVHASDSAESAAYEIPLFFNEGEAVEYRRTDEDWL